MRYRLRAARLAAGLTQKSMSQRCGVCFRRISAFENGSRTPTEHELAAICALLNRNVEEFEPTPNLTPQLIDRFRLRLADAGPLRPQPDWVSVSQTYSYQLRLLGFLDDLPLWFRCECTYDSKLEVYAVLQIYSEGATPIRCDPAALDLRNPVVVDREGRSLGVRELPCLYWRRPELEALLCPQVTVLAGRHLCRLDMMLVVHTPYHPPFVVAVEIDGAGHRGTRDRYRAAQLQLPVLRFTEAQVMAGRFGDELAQALLNLSTRLGGGVEPRK